MFLFADRRLNVIILIENLSEEEWEEERRGGRFVFWDMISYFIFTAWRRFSECTSRRIMVN